MGASHFSFDDRTLNRVLVQSDRDEETQTPRLPPQTQSGERNLARYQKRYVHLVISGDSFKIGR